MTNPTKTSFASNEPVFVGAFVAWLLSVAGTFILGHTDLVTSTQWSTLSTVLVPIVSAVILGVIAKVTREFVTPVWKKVEQETSKWVPNDELASFIENSVKNAVTGLGKSYPAIANVIKDIEDHENDPAVQQVVTQSEDIDPAS